MCFAFEPSIVSRAATIYCESCDTFLCDEHDTIAHSARSFIPIQHDIPTHDSTGQPLIQPQHHSRIPANHKQHPVNCEQHAKKTLDYYCNTCQLLVCSSCFIIGLHKTHDVVEPEDAIKKLRTQLKPTVAWIKTNMVAIEVQHDLIHHTKKSVEQQADSVIVDIKAHFEAKVAAKIAA